MGRWQRPLAPLNLHAAYAGKRVLVTGHTGFKGSWLTLWLESIGAQVMGYSLPPDERSLFRQAGVADLCEHVEGDVRDAGSLQRHVHRWRPDFVFHLAAQSLVRRGYRDPRETFETNVGGTVNLLETIRREGLPTSIVVVTSDKCYENDQRTSPYSENDRLGGSDPYSASKAASEMVVAGYRSSFFDPEQISLHGVALATARAGNVIGGGDWCEDRLLPDAMRSLEGGLPIPIRNPESVRPWQHVLDPLAGYLMLGSRIARNASDRARFCEAWNFGPEPDNSQTVSRVVDMILRKWGSGSRTVVQENDAPRETRNLTLSIEKAKAKLLWSPRWLLEEAISRAIEWYRCALAGAGPQKLADLCRRQIADHGKTSEARIR